MRRALSRVDDNQAEIVAGLRAIGVTCADTSSLGRGFPDLCCGWRGRNVLLELKDGRKPPSARRLTEAEAAWHRTWRGQVAVVESVEDAIFAVTGIRKVA